MTEVLRKSRKFFVIWRPSFKTFLCVLLEKWFDAKG